MSLVRWFLAGLGACGVLVAALASLGGLVGAVWGWPDALNSFVPVWLVMAWAGALVSRAALPPGMPRTGLLILAAVAVLVSGAPMLIESVNGARETVRRPAALTLLTFNRWWDSPDPALAAATIRRSGADVVALQEANGFRPALDGLRDLYPYQLICGGRCDTVIMSKRPILADGRDDGGRVGGVDLVWARTTAADGRPVTVATVHLYWPIPPWIQRAQRERVDQLLGRLPPDDLILTGDFNLTPWSFAMRGLDRSLAPLTRRTHGLLTFPAGLPLPLLALDQVFAGPQWRTVSVERLPRAGSDHYPVRLVLAR